MSDECYWHQLPVIFQRSVVNLLDFNDRCSLRKTSKSDRDLVDTVPNHLMYLGFTDYDSEIRLALEEHPKIIDEIVHFSKYQVSGEEMIRDLFRIFENPHSKVDFLYFDFENVDSHEWLSKFHEELLKQPENFKLRAKKIAWNIPKSNDFLFDLVVRLDAKVVKNVELNCHLTPEILQQILETEQCQNAKSLGIGSSCCCTLPVKSLMKWNYLDVYIHRISENEIWEMIKNFRSTPRPIGSRFHFYNYKPDNRIVEIPVLLALFDVPPVNVTHYNEPSKCHAQLFEMSVGDGELKVEITHQGVIGTIMKKISF